MFEWRGSQPANPYRLNNGINNWDIIVPNQTRMWGDSSNLERRIRPGHGKGEPLKSSFR